MLRRILENSIWGLGESKIGERVIEELLGPWRTRAI